MLICDYFRTQFELMRSLILSLHLVAALTLCASPVISYVGQDHFDMEIHTCDKDESGKDVEDENETKDLITFDILHSSQSNLTGIDAWAEPVIRISTEDHMDVFTPPPEA